MVLFNTMMLLNSQKYRWSLFVFVFLFMGKILSGFFLNLEDLKSKFHLSNSYLKKKKKWGITKTNNILLAYSKNTIVIFKRK